MISGVSQGNLLPNKQLSLTHGLNTGIKLLGYISVAVLAMYSLLWVYYIIFPDQTLTWGRIGNKQGPWALGRQEVREVKKKRNMCKLEKLRSGKINCLFHQRQLPWKTVLWKFQRVSLQTCSNGACALTGKLHTVYNSMTC